MAPKRFAEETLKDTVALRYGRTKKAKVRGNDCEWETPIESSSGEEDKNREVDQYSNLAGLPDEDNRVSSLIDRSVECLGGKESPCAGDENDQGSLPDTHEPEETSTRGVQPI